jgi:hypothetical protein
MRISSSIRCALGIAAAAAMLAGCGSGASQAGLGSTLPTAPSASQPSFGQSKSQHSDRGPSRMAPDAKASDLLYVSDVGTNDVYVYSYPKLKLKGTLTGFATPDGECVDKAGNVFITNFGTQQIFEYAHGGTNKTLTLSDPGYYPQGCAVDPTTGNIAVTNYSNSDSVRGNVAIYTGGGVAPAAYYTDDIMYEMFLCGYDTKGNLFVDGERLGSGGIVIAELPHAATSFKDMFLNQSIVGISGIQWDGGQLMIGDSTVGMIYHFTVKGAFATKVGSTPLGPTPVLDQFTIQGAKVVAAYGGGTGLWNYPAGGSPIRVVENTSFEEPFGTAISVARR